MACLRILARGECETQRVQGLTVWVKGLHNPELRGSIPSFYLAKDRNWIFFIFIYIDEFKVLCKTEGMEQGSGEFSLKEKPFLWKTLPFKTTSQPEIILSQGPEKRPGFLGAMLPLSLLPRLKKVL